MTQRAPAACLLLLFFIASAKASSVEWLAGHDLEQSCETLLEDARNPDGGLCLPFMQGFIAGGDTSDGAAAPDSAVSLRSEDETYAQRAARTRLGTLRMQQMQSSVPPYCIDETTPALEVVRKVTTYLEDHASAADLTAYDAVREALVHSFPCKR